MQRPSRRTLIFSASAFLLITSTSLLLFLPTSFTSTLSPPIFTVPTSPPSTVSTSPPSTVSTLPPSTVSTSPTEPITYIPYTFGHAMLMQTLCGYQNIGWRNIVIVDNSWKKGVFRDREALKATYGVREIIATPVHLRFAQIQGFIDNLARGNGEKTYFWSHTDVLLLSSHTDAYDRALRSVQVGYETDPSTYAITFFSYDWLSSVGVAGSGLAPWDPATPQYGADCDRYGRLRRAGAGIFQNEIEVGTLMHLHSVLSESEQDELFAGHMTMEEQVAFVQEISDSRDQYSWRQGDKEDVRDGITPMDTAAKEAEGSGGGGYMSAKWGDGWACELVGRDPRWDVQREDAEE